MKNLSYWAIMNPWKSQTLLVLCHLCLAVLAIYSGVWLFAHDIIVPKPFFYLGEILFFAALILYPIRRARYKFWKPNFVRQKIMDGFFVMSYVLMVVSLSNTDARLAWNDTSETPYVEKISMRASSQFTTENAEKAPVLSRQALRKQFRTFVTSMKARAAEPDGNKAARIVGVVFLMLILESLVVGLACAALCSGGGALGGIVMVAGSVGVIALGIWWIRIIQGKRKSNYQPTPPPPPVEKL